MCINLPTLKFLVGKYNINLPELTDIQLEDDYCMGLAGGFLDTADVDLLFDPRLVDLFVCILRNQTEGSFPKNVPRDLMEAFASQQTLTRSSPGFRRFEKGFFAHAKDLPDKQYCWELEQWWRFGLDCRKVSLLWKERV